MATHGNINVKEGNDCAHVRGDIGVSRTLIVVTDSVQEDERGDQGHTSVNLCISLPRENAL
jgi:hypothetical protein